jgi:hypothetical protein
MATKPLYRTTIVIWSEFDPTQVELEDLAREATSAKAHCSAQESVLVPEPDREPAFACGDFFDPSCDEEEDNEEDADRKIRTTFRFVCPDGGADIAGTFDHMTGRCVLVPRYNPDDLDEDRCRQAPDFCDEHDGNDFYMRDVRDALEGDGVDMSTFQEDRVQRYRFGARVYTEAEIREIGFGHGRDGIMYYPPQDWGEALPARTRIDLHPWPLEAIYQAGYREGYHSRHPKED